MKLANHLLLVLAEATKFPTIISCSKSSVTVAWSKDSIFKYECNDYMRGIATDRIDATSKLLPVLDRKMLSYISKNKDTLNGTKVEE